MQRNKLVVFISSTSDLKSERDAVSEVLLGLNLDASRFEFWPASSNRPIDECLEQVENSNIFLLILGSNYGKKTEFGISATHKEYLHAIELNKIIFVYVLDVDRRESEQEKFIEEVGSKYFYKIVRTTEKLKHEVKLSILQELTKRFLFVESLPPTTELPASKDIPESSDTPTFDNPEMITKQLESLYQSHEDFKIHQLGEAYELKFKNFPEILNYIYMSETNLSMNGYKIKKSRLEKSIRFWEKKKLKSMWKGYSLKYNQGNAHLGLSDFKKAIYKYKKVLKERPDFAECWKNLGSAYLGLGDNLNAENSFQKALEYNPLLFEANYSMGTLLSENDKDLKMALSYFNRVLFTPLPSMQHASLLSWKAIIYLKLGNYAEGIACAEDAISLSPETKWAWATAGSLYALARRDNKKWSQHAMYFWERFVNKYPDESYSWAELGFIYLFYRNGAEHEFSKRSIFAFKKAINLGFKDDGLVFDKIGHFYQAKGDWNEAEIYYRKASEISPNLFGYCLGVSLIFLNRHEEALPWVLSAAKNHQPDALSWFQVAVCHENLGNFDEMIESYEKAIDLDPNYPEPQFKLGEIYWNILDIPKATEIWSNAIKKFPNHPLSNKVKKLLGK